MSEVQYVYVHDNKPGWSGLGIASFVLSLLWLGGVGSLLAVIFGHIGEAETRDDAKTGRGMAVAGMLLGYLGILLTVVLFIAAANQPDYSYTPSYGTGYGSSYYYGGY